MARRTQSTLRRVDTKAWNDASAVEIVAAIRQDLRGCIVTPAIRGVRQRHAKALRDVPPETVLAVCDMLLDGGSWPERVVGSELLVDRSDALALVRSAAVERWAKDLADWGSVDLYGVTVAGVAWRAGRLSDRHVMRWARSPDRWRRRLALVATVPLNARSRGGTGDAEKTLQVCRALADDRDDMVVKALSWALRELAKQDRASVARFMRDEGEPLAARVRREVISKLDTGRARPKARSRR